MQAECGPGWPSSPLAAAGQTTAPAARNATPVDQDPDPAAETDDPDDQNGIPVIRTPFSGGQDRVLEAQNAALGSPNGVLCRLCRF